MEKQKPKQTAFIITRSLPNWQITLLILFLFFGLALALLTAVPAMAAPSAANPDGDLRIEPITAYNFVVDSNVLSPSTYAPESATLGAKICNDGTNDLTDVFMYIGDFSGGTPGIYPTRDSATFAGEHDHLLNTGLYSLTHEGGSLGLADATRYISAIPAGECVTQYWLVSYPRTNPAGTVSVTGGSIKPFDDLWLEYDIWATAQDGGTPLAADVTTKVTMRNEISAAANKIWPNGDNKVPDEYLNAIADVLGWDTFVPGGGTTAYPGQTIRTQGIWYDLGNVGFGFDNNGDLVPDHNAWLQPVGVPDNYDPGCFRLVRTYGLVIVKLVTGGELLIPFEDQLYFENIPDNTGTVGLVYYEYAALDGACTAGLTPYQEVASGYDNEKFNGDFGYGIPPLESVEPELTMSKVVAPGSVAPGGTLTYTITYTNPPTYSGGLPAVTVGSPSLGIPLVVQEPIPAGTCYTAGTADDNAPPSEYTILYSTDSGSTWSTTEPGDTAPADGCNDTTDIQWWRTTALDPDTSDFVTFEVTVPGTYVESTVENTAGLSFGNSEPFLEDSETAFVTGPNSLSGTVFNDTGAGAGEFANSFWDAGETTISNVTVDLYYDTDCDGVGDIFYGTTTSDGTGAYSFASLPDGCWVTEVDVFDSDITTGYSNTTPRTRAADLDSGHLSATGVTQTGLDFGFAPALSVNKTLDTSGTIRVNDKVTYTITVSNNLPGNGTGITGLCTYYVWTSDVHPTTGEIPSGGGNNAVWQFPENAIGRPDEKFAFSIMSDNADVIGLSGMNIGDMGGTITKVEYVFNVHERLNLDPTQQFNIAIYYADSEVDTYQYLGNDATYFGTGGTGTEYFITGILDPVTITGNPDFYWTDFTSDLMEMQLEVKGASGNGDIDLDAAGFIITTNQTCSGADNALNPVPLTDTFDSSYFSFDSAYPQPSSTGSGTITWDNLGPIFPGQTKSISVTLLATGIVTDSEDIANSTGSEYSDGRLANSPEEDNAFTTVAAAFSTPGSISGYIWDDEETTPYGWVPTDGYEGTDTFIENAKVTLYACKDNASGELVTDTGNMKDCTTEDGAWIAIQTTYSAADGSYSFTNLSDGYYIVRVDESSIVGTTGQTGDPNETTGLCSDCDNASNDTALNMDDGDFLGKIDGGNNITGINFGYPAPDGTSSTIGDRLFYDWDGEADFDTGVDEGIPNVTVNLYDSGGNLVDTTTTDAAGNYLFTALPAGAYTVEVDTTDLDFPAGLVVQTLDPDNTGVCSLCNNTGTAYVDGSNSDLDQDFAYQPFGGYAIGDTVWLDKNGDGTQSGVLEVGIPDIKVSLQVDLDGDGTWVTVAEVDTDANGNYLFENLPTGNYQVFVDTADPQMPQDAFGNNLIASTPTGYAVTITTADILNADFGFYEPGAVGDTIFWDNNGDGEQDFGEPGIEGVTVTVYNDVNGNGVYDSGTDTYVDEAITDADGHYLITGIPTDADGEAYVVVVDTGAGSPVETATLTADPNADGLACTTSPEPWTDFWLYCDGQVATDIFPGTNYLGADFGYQPNGSFGDYIWLDQNGDGVQDAGEIGLDFVDVTATTTDAVYVDGVLYPAGTSITVTTDSDGYYFFNDIFAETGTATWTITVDTADLPVGVVPSYDPDGTLDDSTTLVIDDTGTVTQVGGSACTDCSLDADFGYTYTGTLNVSGTVCLENSSPDGVCDIDNSGVGTNESAFQGVTVYLYIWTDTNTDGIVGPGETAQVGTTTTNIDGDYSFSNVPGSVTYVTAIGAPIDHLDLTTTVVAVGAPTTQVVATLATDGDVASVYQVFSVGALDVDNRDFAFEFNLALDFGDLPVSYSTVLTDTPDGPRHIVPATPTLYLGTTVDTESNGVPTTAADGDGADEDGVSFVGVWGNGSYDAVNGTGGEVQVDVVGSGWLIGWIDFNRDGDFTDTGEMIVSQSVTTGLDQSFTFDIPAETFVGTGDPTALDLYARFRLFDSQPTFPSLSYAGLADNGEVEDYQLSWIMTIDKDTTTPSVNAGNQGSYTIVVRNEGTQVLSNVSVSDVLPSGSGWSWTYASISHTETNASFTSDECVDGVAPDPADGDLNDFTCAKWNINAGGFVTLTVLVDVDANTPQATYSNTASATSSQTGLIDDDGTLAQDADTPLTLDPVDDEDITVTLTASIGDYVWYDANGDGVQDGTESGIDGVTVDLWLDVNNNGQIDPGTDTLIGTQTTAGSGGYSFTDLTPDRYLVDVTDTAGLLSGYYQTFGTDPHDVTVVGGDNYVAADFGYNTLTLSLELIKNASPVIYDAAGDSITYTYTLHNAGNVTINGPFVVLDDKATVDCSLAAASLTPDDGSAGGTDETTCTATYNTTAGDVTAQSVTNTATAYAGNIPAISVAKSASPTIFSSDGELINYSYTVTNTGNVTLNNITLDDDLAADESCPQTTLDPGASMVCTATYTTSLADLAAGFVTNTVTVDSDETAPVVDAATVATDQSASLTIEKSAAPGSYSYQNQLVYYSYLVTNTGNADLTNITVTDDTATSVSCPANSLLVGGSMTCVASYPVTAADMAAGLVTNTATADSTETNPVTDTLTISRTPITSNTDTETVYYAGISISKEVYDPVAGTWGETVTVLTGDTVDFHILVSNTGAVDLTNIVVDDDYCSASLAYDSGDDGDNIMQPGETWTYLCSVTATAGTTTNTASADSDETDPAVTDTASYTANTIGINLEKTPANQIVLNGDDAVFSLQVTNTGDLPLTNIVIDDLLCDTLSGPTGDLSPFGWLGLTETWIYQCTVNTVTTDFTNNAQVDGEDASGNPVTDTASADVDVIHPNINLEKTVYAGSSGASGCPGVETITGTNGTAITYCFVVTTSGDVPLDITSFSDPLIGGGIALGDLTPAGGEDTNSNGLLDAGESWTYTYATTINGDLIPNTASINGQPTDSGGTALPGIPEVTDSDTANVDEIVTDLTLDKTLTSGSPYTNVGDVLNYSYTVTNTGGTILAGPVTVVDDTIGSFTCGDLTTVGNFDTNFDPGESVTCTNTYLVTQLDINLGSVVNIAYAQVGGETSPTDTATANANQLPDLTISKLPDLQSVPINTTFSFTVLVTNSGNTVLNNIQVTDNLASIFGAGNYTLIGFPAVTTTGLLPANPGYDGNSDSNLLNPSLTRSLAAGQTETITITLQVSTTGSFTNTAYAQAEDPGGSPVGPENDAGQVTLTNAGTFSIQKNLVSTELGLPSGSGNQPVAIGELLTYQVIVTLHDPSVLYEDVVIVDTLDHGLAFHSCASITAPFVPTLACAAGSGLPDVAPPVGIPPGEDDGHLVYFDLGDITTPASTDNEIILTYRAVVLNIDDNQSLPITTLDNLASWGTTAIADSADPVDIVEPNLSILKTSNNPVANAGDLISFDITIRHTADSNAPAYDVIMHDVIPAGLVYSPSTNPNHRLESISGPAPTDSFVGGEVQAYWSVINPGEVAVVRLWVSIDPSVPPGTSISNEASVEWSSLPGDESSPRSAYNDYSTERYYDPADPDNINIYGGITSADVVTVGGINLPDQLPQTGFAPDQVTVLLEQPSAYTDYDQGLWLEIPILGISETIVGVPMGENGWDTTWLWNQLGYLQGTAFPTWEGNTAITGHVYLPDGTPGPFVRIGLLRWGNQIIIHSNGLKYTYEVRSNKIVFPNDTSVLGHTDEDWLTLLTCSYYNQAANEYRFRLAVKAVLVSIETE
jgi:LPXTG-site transpeptidase (sortase) family protein